MRVLIVEDNHRLADSIKKGLTQERFVVDTAYDGTEGYDLASSENYDVMILDLMLPGMDGIEITKKLRKEKVMIPILMLTAKGETHDKVSGLNSGADDYLTKPFDFEELLARIKALSRRPKRKSQETLRAQGVSLNTTTYEVKNKNKNVKLSKKEYALLEYMMRNKNKVLTKEQIINSVWPFDSDILPNTVEVYVRYLRKKLDSSLSGTSSLIKKSPSVIKTVRGFGYKLTDKK